MLICRAVAAAIVAEAADKAIPRHILDCPYDPEDRLQIGNPGMPVTDGASIHEFCQTKRPPKGRPSDNQTTN
jgi:hypothetical protein